MNMPLKKYCSSETSKKWQIVVAVLFGCSLAGGLVVLFIVGGTIYYEERSKELTYESDRCLVNGKDIQIYWCSSRANRQRCYAPVWHVSREHHNTSNTAIFGNGRFRSKSDADQKADQYEIGSIYSCWYDTNDPLAVQWGQPDADFGLILLILGGLCILPLLFSVLMIYKLCRDVRDYQHQSLLSPHSHIFLRDFSSISKE